ncbi:MAG: LuxR C-terminal-related transcriptional regulator [Candidatus Neomarinimicrobiota bacterium]|jgi:DNA-binding CsgD family transcriptional regulator
MSEFCKSCPAKPTCESICPELELHLKESEAPQRELTIGLPRHGRVEWSSPSVKLTKTEREILTLIGKGLSRDDVCQTLNISRQTLRVHVANMKKKHEKP